MSDGRYVLQFDCGSYYQFVDSFDSYERAVNRMYDLVGCYDNGRICSNVWDYYVFVR